MADEQFSREAEAAYPIPRYGSAANVARERRAYDRGRSETEAVLVAESRETLAKVMTTTEFIYEDGSITLSPATPHEAGLLIDALLAEGTIVLAKSPFCPTCGQQMQPSTYVDYEGMECPNCGRFDLAEGEPTDAGSSALHVAENPPMPPDEFLHQLRSDAERYPSEDFTAGLRAVWRHGCDAGMATVLRTQETKP